MFESLLLLVYFFLVSSHWICDLEGGESCVTSPGDEIITEGFAGGWISHKIQVTVPNELNCAFTCIRLNCALYIYPQEFKCMLAIPGKPKTLATAGSARHFNLKKLTNVALLKPTYASSVKADSYIKKRNAVDGVTEGGIDTIFSTNSNDRNGWFVVDLESKFVIRAVRFFGRTDVFNPGHLQATIYAGNSLILDGDFSSHTPLVSIPEERPSVNSHYFVSFVNTKPYRYVALKKEFTEKVLSMVEFEVYA